MVKIFIKLFFGIALLISTIVIALVIYETYWINKAEAAVIDYIENSINKETPENTIVLNYEFSAGDIIKTFENIGLGYRAYEIRICTEQGNQYNIDAVYVNENWEVSCCSFHENSKWC